jgi:hypothetical protein
MIPLIFLLLSATSSVADIETIKSSQDEDTLTELFSEKNKNSESILFGIHYNQGSIPKPIVGLSDLGEPFKEFNRSRLNTENFPLKPIVK